MAVLCSQPANTATHNNNCMKLLGRDVFLFVDLYLGIAGITSELSRSRQQPNESDYQGKKENSLS